MAKIYIRIYIPKEYKTLKRNIAKMYSKSDFEYMGILGNETIYSHEIPSILFLKYIEDAITGDFTPGDITRDFSQDLEKLSDIANYVFDCGGTIRYQKILQ